MTVSWVGESYDERLEGGIVPDLTERDGHGRLSHDRGNASQVAVCVVGRELPLTLRVEKAARLVGLGRSSMYAAIKRGEFASMRIGGRIVVLTLPLLRRMGLDAALVGDGDDEVRALAEGRETCT